MKKRMLSMLLTLCMLMAIIPSGASAADETGETGNQQLEQSAILSDLTNYYWFYNIQDSRVWSFTEDGYAIQYWPKNYISLSNAADTQIKESEMTIVPTEAYAYRFDGSTLKLYSDTVDNSGNVYPYLAITLDLYNKQTSPANMKDSYAEGCIEEYNGNNYFYQTDWVRPDPNSDDWDSNAMYLVRLGKKEQKTGDDFQANRDGNSFRHSDGKDTDGTYFTYREGTEPGFYRVGNYNINDTNVYNRLTDRQWFGAKALIKYKMDQDWDGSCYGIAASMKLVYDKILDLNSIKQTNHAANCYYELPKPYEDSIFLNTIQYYQLSQFRSDHAEDVVYNWYTNNLKLIIEKLKEESPLLLTYKYSVDDKKSGHSILALSYQKTNNGYTVNLFDENGSKYCKMTIAKDYSTFNFTDGNGYSITPENCTYMSLQTSSQIYNVVPYDVTLQQSSTNTSHQLESASTSAIIIVSMNTDCTISNTEGQQLILKDGEIASNSTMHIINYHAIMESENPQWYIEVSDSEQFFITEATDNIQVGIFNKNYFLSFESDGFVQDDTLVYTIGSGINVQKSDDATYNFTAYASSDEMINPDETALYSISGTASGNTSISVDEADISAESDGSLNDVNAYVYADIDRAKIQGDNVAPFLDVQDVSLYYYRPVNWAAEHGIAAGVGAYRFAPNQSCTRSQVVAFLWRAMGSPAPTTTECPFVDVKSSDYFYKAILWAVENGITYGTDDTHFSPNATVTRADFVTFLWRAEKRPSYNVQSTFVDIPSNSYYAGAVLWAAENKVAYGVDDTHFAPAQFCTRGQVVSFLYRDLA